MAKTQSTRIAVDLLEAAEIEGLREHRSMAQQIEHWARVGREVTLQESSVRRVFQESLEAVPRNVSAEVVARGMLAAETNARIQNRMLSTQLPRILAGQGIDTVALDEDGRLVEYRADGTRTVLLDELPSD